jgi:hypothetical protein
MATAMSAETVENLQHSTRLIPKTYNIRRGSSPKADVIHIPVPPTESRVRVVSTLMLRTREDRDSNLGQETGCPDWGFS